MESLVPPLHLHVPLVSYDCGFFTSAFLPAVPKKRRCAHGVNVSQITDRVKSPGDTLRSIYLIYGRQTGFQRDADAFYSSRGNTASRDKSGEVGLSVKRVRGMNDDWLGAALPGKSSFLVPRLIIVLFRARLAVKCSFS